MGVYFTRGNSSLTMWPYTDCVTYPRCQFVMQKMAMIKSAHGLLSV